MTGTRAGRAVLMLALAILLMLPSAWILHPTGNVAAYSGISIELDYPAFAGKGQSFECTLQVSGGPAADKAGNYSYRAEIIGTNTTGSLVTPSTATSATGEFKFNVTMPSTAPQDIKIRINATSKESATSVSRTTEQDFAMKAVDPIVIKATVFNRGSVDAQNVSVDFYADGSLLETRVVTVSASSSQEVKYNWTFLKIKSGKHVVTVTVDDPNDVVEFSDGNNVFSRTIYVGKQGNPAGAVLTMGVIIMSVLVALMYISKPPPRKKKP